MDPLFSLEEIRRSWHICLRACLHGGGGGRGGNGGTPDWWGNMYCGSPHIACKRDQIKMRDYMDRRVTSPISLMSRNACNGDNGENQIGWNLESGDFDENGRNGEKSPEGWRVYGNCLCLSCPRVYLAYEHAWFCTMWMISCKRPILPLDINWKNYFSCCSAVFSS